MHDTTPLMTAAASYASFHVPAPLKHNAEKRLAYTLVTYNKVSVKKNGFHDIGSLFLQA